MIEPISVAEIGIKDVEIGQVRFRLAAALRVVLDFNGNASAGTSTTDLQKYAVASGRCPA
jgi:hypothetical protein